MTGPERVERIVPRPASTVALLRPGPAGPEVLMTHRPASMAFGPGLHVFPGGAVDPGDAEGPLLERSVLDAAGCAAAWAGDLGPREAIAHAVAAIRELYEEAGVLLATARGMAGDAAEVAAAHAAGESLAALAERLDLVLRTDRLVPLSRWVTPPFDTPRRYDTRFFVAALEDPAGVDIHPTEVLAHEWITPAAALAAGADGRIALWTPTSTTLAQLAGAGDLADVRRYLAPRAAPAPPGIIAERAGVVSVRLHGAGGIPGLSVVAHVVGRKRLVVVDPGDPGEAAIDAFLAIAADLGASIVAVLLTAPEPDHAAGASALADRVGVPVMASAACARAAAALLGGPAEGLLDGDTVTLGDMPLVVLATPGTHPGHLAFAVPSTDVVLVGDLWGPGPSRGIPGRTDTGALERSRAKVRDLAAARQLPAHR